MPAGNQAVAHVRVGAREILGDRLVLTLEHQHCAVDRIGERSGNDNLPSLGSGPGVFQMLGPKLRPALEIVRARFVEEQEMSHLRPNTSGRRSCPQRCLKP